MTRSRYARSRLSAVLWITLVGGVSAGQVDLSGWTVETYPIVIGPVNWTLAPDHLSVYESENCPPTLFYSDFSPLGVSLRATVSVDASDVDDDYIGFLLGFSPGDTMNPDADFLMVDWKRATQFFDFNSISCTPGTTASVGLAVSHVFGTPTADELWGHVNLDTPACSGLASGVVELQRAATLGATGWEPETEYTFEFQFDSDSLIVFVDGNKEIDITGDFSDGRFAFWDLSQAGVTFRAWTGTQNPVRPYGCGTNPAGSLNLIGGHAVIGEKLVFGVDNPVGTQASGLAFLMMAVKPDGNFPCGKPVPNLGMAAGGARGELLISPPLYGTIGGEVWSDTSGPAKLAIAIPNDTAAIGLPVYVQGYIIDLTGAPVAIGLTSAAHFEIGV